MGPQLHKTSRTTSFMGYAVSDKPENSRTLRVWSNELLPFLQGEVTATEAKGEIKTTGRKGEYTATITKANYIEAEWRDENSGNAFPPDVRKGEEVIITNYGDTDNFTWKSAARNDNARRTETKRFSISGTLENAPSLTDDNTYFIEMDTRRTHRIRISTSNQDEEEHRYLICIDADKSMLSISDDINNTFIIDSNVPRVVMRNADESIVDLNTKNIVMMCKKDITIISEEGNINIDARKGYMTQHSKDDMTMKTDSEMYQYSTKAMHIQTDDSRDITVAKDQTTTVNGAQSTTVVKDDTWSITGNRSTTVQGTYDVTSLGNMSFSTQGNYSASAMGTGSLSSMGPMTVGGSTTTIQAQGGVSIAAGGALSMSFQGQGVAQCNGGQMTFNQVGAFNING